MVGSEKQQWRYDNSKNAQQSMRGGEEAATKEVPKIEDNSDSVKEAEDSAPINYTGGQGSTSSDKKTKGKGIFKRKGAIGFIMALLLGGGGLMMGSQSLMPFSLAEQMRETFDSIKTSTEIRSNTMWKAQLANKNVSDPIHKKFFGFGRTEFKVTSKQRKKLKSQGIYVQDVEVNGKTKSIMLFDDGSGQFKIIAAAGTDIDTLKALDVSSIDLKNLDADVDLSHMGIDTSDIKSFESAFEDVADFRNGYIKSSRTWRGSVKAWFDSVAYRFLQSNRLTRNRFKKFQERVAAEQAGNTRSAEAAKKATADLMDTDVDELEVQTHTIEAEDADKDGQPELVSGTNQTDADGNELKDPNTGKPVSNLAEGVEMKEDKFKLKFGASRTEIKEKMNKIKNSKLGKASGYVSAAVNVACAIFDVIGAINLLIAAQEIIQVVQVATSFFESVDKVKAGDGSGSPLNVLAEGLTTPMATTVMQNTTYDRNTLENSEDIAIEEVIAEGKSNTTAMQSSSIASLYGGQLDPNDASVQNFNIGSRFSSILGYFTNSVESFAACGIARATAAIAGMVTDIIAIATCAVSFGIGCVVDAIIEAGTSVASSVAIGLGANLAINYITPLAVKTFTRDLVSNLAGEDFGNALVSGASVYMGQNHLQGGGSLATRGKYTSFAIKQQEVIAEEARFERETRDPFDITSQYTFAGSLLKQVAAIHTLPSSIFGALGATARMVSSSITAMLPSASAYDISSSLIDEAQYENVCPYLSSIGAVGDAFCNPYMTTDVSTITMDPLSVVDVVKNKGGLDDSGNIVKGSGLSNYILYCSQRSSAFGVADGNIANAFDKTNINTGNSTADTVVGGVVGSVPVVGDLIDIIGNSEKLANTGWVTGESCVANEEDLTFGTSWSENQYYQRFVEDQRYLEGLDDNYTSAVTAFLDEYYEENPLDNSYEGILARKAGMTKDDVIALLDLVEYWDYIANYNPSTRYQMGEKQIARRVDFGGEVIGESKTVILMETPIWDRRQRNIAVA